MSDIPSSRLTLSTPGQLAASKSGQSHSKNGKTQGTTLAPPVIVPTGPAAIVMTSLNEKVQDLQRLLDKLGQNVQTLSRSRDASNEAVGFLEELGGITVRARDTHKTDFDEATKAKRIAELEERFNGVIERLSKFIEGTNFNGVNLLKGESLTTQFDSSGKNNLVTEGIDLLQEALQFKKVDFSTPEAVQGARIDVMNAIDISITLRHILSSDLILIQTRQEFSEETISALSSNTESPADINEEAANLLALQIRQQLETTDASLASEGQQYLLRQF